MQTYVICMQELDLVIGHMDKWIDRYGVRNSYLLDIGLEMNQVWENFKMTKIIQGEIYSEFENSNKQNTYVSTKFHLVGF